MAQRGEEPKPGDMIEISRTVYAHWALYVGDGYVVHWVLPYEYPDDSCLSFSTLLSDRAVVKLELLKDVVGDCSYKVNNYLDDQYLPRPVPLILSAAKEVVGQELPYSVYSGNSKPFVTSLRYGKTHSQQRGEEPKPGDMIEISRTVYAHWALYVGDGYVVHLVKLSDYPGAGSSSLISVLSDRAVVKRELLKDVVGDCSYEVNNYLDDQYLPRPVPLILSAAKEMIGQELPYSVFSPNCENFVTSLRYGKSYSKQVRDGVMAAGIMSAGLATVGLVGVMLSRNKRQKQ